MLNSFVQSTISADITCTCCTDLFRNTSFFFILLLHLLLPFHHPYSYTAFFLPFFLVLLLSPSPSFSSPPSSSFSSTPTSHFFSFHFFYSYSCLIPFLQSGRCSIVDGTNISKAGSIMLPVSPTAKHYTPENTTLILITVRTSNVTQSSTQLLMFLKNLLPPSSGKNWSQLLLLPQLCFMCSGSRYGCDPTTVSCSLQWSLNTDQSSFVYNICLLILGGILPAALMYVQLWNNNLQGSKFAKLKTS